jgi:hypothetical protein
MMKEAVLGETASDVTAWRRWFRMLQLCVDGFGCYSLAEMASDVTAWQRWPRMLKLAEMTLDVILAEMAPNVI